MSFSSLTRGLSSFLFKSFNIGSNGDGDNAKIDPDDPSLFQSTAAAVEPPPDVRFDVLRTVPSFCVHLLVTLSLLMVGVVYAFQQCNKSLVCPDYYMLLYLRAVFWVITYLVHLYNKSRHQRLKVTGYHLFAQRTHYHKKALLQLVSFGCALFLTTHTVMLHYYGRAFLFTCTINGLSAVDLITGYSFLEAVVLFLIQISYIVQVRVFNVTRPLPDALQNYESLNSKFSFGQRSVNGTFERTATDARDFVGMQSSLIAKLRDENAILQAKIGEFKTLAAQIPNESLSYSIAEQSFVGY